MSVAPAASSLPNGECGRLRAPAGGNRVTVVLGAQWGDEGKGKVVDLLAQDADIVCRCQVRRRGADVSRAGSPYPPPLRRCHLEVLPLRTEARQRNGGRRGPPARGPLTQSLGLLAGEEMRTGRAGGDARRLRTGAQPRTGRGRRSAGRAWVAIARGLLPTRGADPQSTRLGGSGRDSSQISRNPDSPPPHLQAPSRRTFCCPCATLLTSEPTAGLWHC